MFIHNATTDFLNLINLFWAFNLLGINVRFTGWLQSDTNDGLFEPFVFDKSN